MSELSGEGGDHRPSSGLRPPGKSLIWDLKATRVVLTRQQVSEQTAAAWKANGCHGLHVGAEMYSRAAEIHRSDAGRMETLLLVLTASALGATSPVPRGEYHFIYEPKNWTEARRYCTENHSDLVPVRNQEDVTVLRGMAVLSQMVYPHYSYRAWIGLYNSMTSWSWSMPGLHQNQSGFRNWNQGEPNHALGKVQCAEIYYSGVWNDAPCEWKRSFVCCDVSGPAVSFVYVGLALPWNQAQSHCRGRHTDLAVVRDAAENQRLQRLVPFGQSAWIGLFRYSWQWVDGGKFPFSLWGAADPNGPADDCAAANFQDYGRWETWSCGEEKAFVCYRAPVLKQVVRLRLGGDSSLDLSDPVVLEDVLKEVKQA
ncbi:unnamed protein product [Menidia menidia]|uniref:(Atlantic silverside) hypothetical protein n=1 Tax=Menidia menidia TaxID=238744 RepID=A0A8S4BFJ1_9TELE|nr:unnamed protein product [Menidia menidia]